MRKPLITIIIVLGLPLVIAGIWLLIYPELLVIPGRILILIGVAIIFIASSLVIYEDFREILYSTVPRRTQEMTNSEEGKQTMRGKGGVQKQKMDRSPRGKQTME